MKLEAKAVTMYKSIQNLCVSGKEYAGKAGETAESTLELGKLQSIEYTNKNHLSLEYIIYKILILHDSSVQRSRYLGYVEKR